MNIALFSDTYVPEINGVAASTSNLAHVMMSHGHQCIVVTSNPYSNEVTFEDGVIRIPGFDMKRYYGYNMAFSNPKAMKIIERFRPDIVHCQSDGGMGIFGPQVAKKLHIACVYTFHTMVEDYTYYVTGGHFDRAARQFVRTFYQTSLQRFDHLIAPSDKILDYLRSIDIDHTVSVIPTGIEFERFSIENRNAKDVAALKKELGIAPDDYVITILGRIAKEKSIDVLLRGYKAFLEEGESRPTKMVITGFGPAEEELKTLAGELGIKDHVIFTGKCAPNETQRYYHLGDCFASASLSETQGLTYMEAMAASLLVLARYDDNLVGTIQDGETGFFFFDEADFATKLRSVMGFSAAQRKRVINNALKAIQPYSLEKFYQSVYEVYQRAIRKNW